MKPVTMRMVVDLPAPLGPRKPSTSPRSTVNEMSFTAILFPNALVRFSTLIMHPSGGAPRSPRAPSSYYFSEKICPARKNFKRRPRPTVRRTFDMRAAKGSQPDAPQQKGRRAADPGAGADSLNRTDDLPLTRRLLYR